VTAVDVGAPSFATLRRAHQRARRRAVVASAIAVLAIFSLPFLFGHVLFGRDLTYWDIGLVCAAKRQLAESHSLLVSPFIGNGIPLLLSPESQLFSPIRWMTLLLPADWAASVGVVVHLSLAGAAMCILALSFRVRPVVASFAGVAFALIGPVLDLIVHGMYIVGAVALPLAWAGARISSRRPTVHLAPLVVTAAVAFALAGGEPQAAGIAVALVLFEAVSAARLHHRRLTHAVPLAGALVAGLLIGSFPWWGTFAELALTGRNGPLDLERALEWGLDSSTLVSMFVPGFTTTAHPIDLTLYAHLFGKSDTWIQEAYLGAPLAALFLIGTICRRARGPLVVASIGALSALGAKTPFLPLMMKLIPGVASFRYPAKYLVVTVIAVVVVAALGSDRIARNRKRVRAGLRETVVILVVNLILAIVVVIAATRVGAIASSPDDTIARDFLFERLLTIGGLGCLMTGLAWNASTREFGVLGVVVIDLALAAMLIVDTGPSIVDARTIDDMIRPALGDAPMVICERRSLKDNAYSDGDALRFNQALFGRKWHVPELQTCDGASSASPYSVLGTRMHKMLQFGVDEGHVASARALGCQVLVTDAPTDEPDARAIYHGAIGPMTPPATLPEAAHQAGPPRILLVEDARPRVAIARNPTLIASEEDVLKALVVIGRTAGAQAAVLDDPLGRYRAPHVPDGAALTSVELEELDTTEAVVTLHGTGGGVVVWNRAFAVGWRAEQGEREIPIVRASGVALAVVVEDVTLGPVTLRYHMPRQALAVGALVVGILLSIVVAFGSVRRARVQNRSPTTKATNST
jgi:hypothetical protein